MIRITTLVLALLAISANGRGQEVPNTPADPYGLTTVGMGTRLKEYPVVIPAGSNASQPVAHENCGDGAKYRIFNMRMPSGNRKLKIAVFTFQPDDVIRDINWESMKESPLPAKLEYVPPVGYGSLSFAWPALLRTPQFVRLQLTRQNDKGLTIQNIIEFQAEIALRESDKPSISWKLDSYITPTRTPIIVGKSIEADPVLFYVTITKQAKKCISKG